MCVGGNHHETFEMSDSDILILLAVKNELSSSKRLEPNAKLTFTAY